LFPNPMLTIYPQHHRSQEPQVARHRALAVRACCVWG
jgi:hypothetical protein